MKRWLLVGPVLLYSVILHEMSHGYVALLNGDPTALNAGRLTLNPIPHIDLWGSILVPLALILSRVPFFIAWAKPVPYDPSLFVTEPRLAGLEVALAGPFMNLLLALTLAVVLRLTVRFLHGSRAGHTVRLMLIYGVIMNCTLMVFNLLPVPPLDGFSVVRFFVPGISRYLNAQTFYLEMALLFLIMMVPRISQRIIFRPAQALAGRLLLWSDRRPALGPA